MPINITNLIDALNAKIAAVDSSTPLSTLNVLNEMAGIVNESSNILRYSEPVPSVLNVNIAGDSANSYFGDFAFSNVDQKYYFSFGKSFSESILDDSSAVNQLKNVGEIQGVHAAGAPGLLNTIYTFPFANDTDTVSSPGNLQVARKELTGFANKSYAFFRGGFYTPTGQTEKLAPIGGPGVSYDVYSFASGGNAVRYTDGDAGNARNGSNHSIRDEKTYQIAGGLYPWLNPSGVNLTPLVYVRNMVSDGMQTQVGAFLIRSSSNSINIGQGFQSDYYGYTAGGYQKAGLGTPGLPLVTWSDIRKFPFASEVDLTVPSQNLSPTITSNTQTQRKTTIYNEDRGVFVKGDGLYLNDFPFSSETITSITNSPGTLNYNQSGFSNSNQGYVQFGQTGQSRTKIPFANLTAISSVSASIPGGTVHHGIGVHQ